MHLLDLPVEILGEVVSFLDTPAQILAFGSTNKYLQTLTKPFFLRTLSLCTFIDGVWRIDQTFDKISDAQLGFVRNIEIVRRIAHSYHPRWKPGPNTVVFDHVRAPIEATTLAHKAAASKKFNERLSQLIRGLRTGQLQSFDLGGGTAGHWTRYFDYCALNDAMITALSSPITRLTSLVLKLERAKDNLNKCEIIDFQHLRYFQYEASRYSSVGLYDWKLLFCILASCQNSLRELHSKGLIVKEPPETHSSEAFFLAYEHWKGCQHCRKCCKKTGEGGSKRIHLEKLEVLECLDAYWWNVARLFREERILEGVKLKEYHMRDHMKLYSRSPSLEFEAFWKDPPLGGLYVPLEYGRGLASTTGITKMVIGGLQESQEEGSLTWVEGAIKGHGSTLRALYIAGDSGLTASERYLLELGGLMPGLTELAIVVGKWMYMPHCIFNSTTFPNLRLFRNNSLPYRDDRTLRKKICQEVLDSAARGDLSSSLQEIQIGPANYIFKIERGIKSGSEGEERLSVIDKTLKEDYGVKITELVHKGTYLKWNTRRKKPKKDW